MPEKETRRCDACSTRREGSFEKDLTTFEWVWTCDVCHAPQPA